MKLHNLHSSPHIVSANKSRRMKLMDEASSTHEENAYTILIREHTGKATWKTKQSWLFEFA
jgi:hypothetical protein